MKYMGWNRFKRDRGQQRWTGFSLPELLLALAISFIIVTILFSSISTVSGLVKKSNIEIERRIELSRAFDFMTAEIQSAQRVNHTSRVAMDGGSTTVDNVVTSSGLNLADLGNYGTLVLYLEVPFTSLPPSVCPVGSSRAGLPPISTDADRIVYDIRPNPVSWLGPQVISRYGRIPRGDGTLDPCSDPVASDILVDSISNVAPSPAPVCPPPGSLSGSGGFMVCVKGGLVDLYLKSKVVNLQTQNITSKVFSRSSSGGTLVAPVLTGARSGGQMNLSWTWGGSGTVTYKLYQAINNGLRSEVYSGSALSTSSTLMGTSGNLNCYVLVAMVGSYMSAESNSVCEAL